MNSNSSEGTDPMMAFAIIGGLIIFVFAAWYILRVPISTAVFSISINSIPIYKSVYQLLIGWDISPYYINIGFPTSLYEDADRNIKYIHEVKKKNVSFFEITNLLLYTAYLIRPSILILSPLSVWMVFRKTAPSRKATREDIYSLAKRMAPLFPQIRVAIYDKKHKGGDDTGPYRREDSPVRFAILNGLLSVHSRDWEGSLLEDVKPVSFGKKNTETDKGIRVVDHLEKGIASIHERCKFNHDLAIEMYKKQLGEKWRSIYDIPVPLQLLFSALALYAKGDKDRSYDLLDEICQKWNPNKIRKHLKFRDKYVSRLINESMVVAAVIESISNHAYVSTVFQGLLFRARSRGRIPSNKFYWLKEYDRTLWYALNQEGGQCGWSESGATRAHLLAERAVKKIVEDTADAALHIPVVSESVNSLYDVLYKEGWISDIYPNKIN